MLKLTQWIYNSNNISSVKKKLNIHTLSVRVICTQYYSLLLQLYKNRLFNRRNEYLFHRMWAVMRLLLIMHCVSRMHLTHGCDQERQLTGGAYECWTSPPHVSQPPCQPEVRGWSQHQAKCNPVTLDINAARVNRCNTFSAIVFTWAQTFVFTQQTTLLHSQLTITRHCYH